MKSIKKTIRNHNIHRHYLNKMKLTCYFNTLCEVKLTTFTNKKNSFLLNAEIYPPEAEWDTTA